MDCHQSPFTQMMSTCFSQFPPGDNFDEIYFLLPLLIGVIPLYSQGEVSYRNAITGISKLRVSHKATNQYYVVQHYSSPSPSYISLYLNRPSKGTSNSLYLIFRIITP